MMQYAISRAGRDFDYQDNWGVGQWSQTAALALTHYMGERPAHFPQVQAKLLYDDEHVYVFFRVEDRYVRAVAKAHHDPVCRDSCAEFFFTPGMDLEEGYFNVEVNCGGTVLFYHQKPGKKDRQVICIDDIGRMRVEHSLPEQVYPEIEAATTWTIKYALPIAILEGYAPVRRPRKDVTWRANLYKCADDSSHPHWLTWSPVKYPAPMFHLPEYFGVLRFD